MRQFLEEYADYVEFPCLLILLVWLDRFALARHPAVWLALFAFGWFVWTFVEYVIHRWVLHGFYWMRIHEQHHRHPREITRFPLWQIPFYFVVIALIAYGLFGEHYVPVYAGFVLGYLTFITMHAMMHFVPSSMQSLAIRHNAHHKTTTCNYGVSVDWWDRVFNTLRQSSKRA